MASSVYRVIEVIGVSDESGRTTLAAPPVRPSRAATPAPAPAATVDKAPAGRTRTAKAPARGARKPKEKK